MANAYFALKFIHILGTAVLFGTGLGIAFFMWMAHRTRNAAAIAHTARVVVTADMVFTATAVVVQPASGAGLLHVIGYSWHELWIVASLALYVIAGICWLPVVRIQMKLRDLAADAARRDTELPEEYHRQFRFWCWLGWPAFLSVLAILGLMIWKPE